MEDINKPSFTPPRRHSPAMVVLADGRVFEGLSAGAAGVAIGELVFNTSMSGYQEILSDPSYAGQLLSFTMPHIGNYGVSDIDMESSRIQVAGLITRDIARRPSSFRSQMSLPQWLEQNRVVAITDVDTRALTRHIRDKGVMMAVIMSDKEPTPDNIEQGLALLREQPGYGSEDFVDRVACTEPQAVNFETLPLAEGSESTGLREVRVSLGPVQEPGDDDRPHVVVVDFGVKNSILCHLHRVGLRLTLVPRSYTPQQIAALKPTGVLLSNGPGDPALLDAYLEPIRALATDYPTLGICLGHQLLARAYGAQTFKLPFGHRGPNQPVKNLRLGTVCMTSQNHGYAVSAENLGDDVEITHLNVNDQTVEGFRHRTLPVFAVQYHPEAGPGPHDAEDCFEEFAASLRIMASSGS